MKRTIALILILCLSVFVINSYADNTVYNDYYPDGSALTISDDATISFDGYSFHVIKDNVWRYYTYTGLEKSPQVIEFLEIADQAPLFKEIIATICVFRLDSTENGFEFDDQFLTRYCDYAFYSYNLFFNEKADGSPTMQYTDEKKEATIADEACSVCDAYFKIPTLQSDGGKTSFESSPRFYYFKNKGVVISVEPYLKTYINLDELLSSILTWN